MALPGLLIEYLISGALSLVWLVPLLKGFGVELSQPGVIPLLALWLYPIGMVIDFVAFWLVKPLKRPIRSHAAKKLGLPLERIAGSSERGIRFTLYAPELAKELAMRSSRDRIARGAVINGLIALVFEQAVSASPLGIPLILGIILVLGLLLIWSVFEYLSFVFELRAEAILDAKLKGKAAS